MNTQQQAIDLNAVRCTLREVLFSVPEITADNFAAENRKFTPPSGLWCRETFYTVKESRVANGVVTGLYSVEYDLFVPVGSGTELVGRVSKAIRGAFRPPKILNGAENVILEEAPQEVGSGVSGPYYSVRLVLYCRAEHTYHPSEN